MLLDSPFGNQVINKWQDLRDSSWPLYDPVSDDEIFVSHKPDSMRVFRIRKGHSHAHCFMDKSGTWNRASYTWGSLDAAYITLFNYLQQYDYSFNIMGSL